MTRTKPKYRRQTFDILPPPPRPPADPRILVCVPTTGVVRMEWSMGFNSLIQPVNWSMSMTMPSIPVYGPYKHHVAAARNLCIAQLLKGGHEWVFFLDHDTIPPADLWVRLNQYTQSREYPVVGGIYYSKGAPSYPLVFRGRGNGVYLKWKRGDRFGVDALPMGCTLIHRSIFEHLPQVEITDGTGGWGWFNTPRYAAVDPETGDFHREVGTEDLDLFERIIRHDVLTKAGWPKLAKQKYPFLADSRIWCQHIDMSGQIFPSIVPKIGVGVDIVLREDF